MNLSDIYYLKLNLSLLSFNIDTSLNIESKEGIIDNNYTKEKLNNLIQKINILTFNKSNSSIMCQILYFLLMSYDLSYSNTLRLCYPVITLNDLKIFKETIYNIISNILPKIILCGKSLLDEACGKKLEKFLRNFSDYIISYKISKEINKKNIIYEQLLEYKNNNENNNILLNIKKNCIITQISNLRENIISKLKNINNIQNKWKINALNISKQLEKENEKNIKLKNKYNLIISGNKSRFSEICSLDRSTKIENHTNFIETINGLHQKFIKNEEFKNNIEYINNKENKDIIDSINSNIILNKNNNIIIKNSIEISKDKKELELLIKELKEKNDKNCELLFVLHEQINNLEQRLKEDNLKFIERNFKKIDNNNNNKEFESKTKKFGIALDEQIEKLKNIEIILNKLKNELV
jgi:hypothetical protein